jgi:hypothetical protein
MPISTICVARILFSSQKADRGLHYSSEATLCAAEQHSKHFHSEVLVNVHCAFAASGI